MLRVSLSKLLAACAGLAALALPCAARDGATVEELEYVKARVNAVGQSGELRVDLAALGREYQMRVSVNPRIDRWAPPGGFHHYRGVLEGVSHSWVRVSIAGQALRGVLYDGRELFAIEPDATGALAMFRMSDAVFDPPLSFAGDTLAVPGQQPMPGLQEKMGGPTGAGAPGLDALTPDRELEVSVVGDAAFRARFTSDAAASDAVLTRLNIVDGIFSAQVGIAINVASINIADAVSDQLDVTTDPPILLDSLGRLRQGTAALNSQGLTHLFTGRDLDGNSVGIGYDGAPCNSRYSASLAEAHDVAGVDGLISAHEIGHVFGAPHDGEGACASTSSTEFIMAPVLNPRATAFSQCSLDQMAPHVAAAKCLQPLSSAPPPSTPPVEQPAPPAGGGGGSGSGGGGGASDALLIGVLALLSGLAARRRIRGAGVSPSPRAAVR